MQYIYVDYENLNKIEKLVKIQGKYFFFIGENQAKIDSSLVYSTNDIDVRWIKISGSGKNALDFHIAYYLAKNDSDKNIEHIILSKDTGFDPLIEHLKKNGVKARRIEKLKDLKVVNKANNSKSKKLSNYDKAVSGLKKMRKDGKPKSIKSLESYTKAQVKNLSKEEMKKIMDRMMKEKIIMLDDNNTLKYLI